MVKILWIYSTLSGNNFLHIWSMIGTNLWTFQRLTVFFLNTTILDKSLGTLLGLSLKSPPLPLDQC